MSNAAFIQEVVNLTNQFRAEHGLKPLSIDLDLTEAAQRHSEDMAYQDYFSHTGKDGSMPWERALGAGYESWMVGENIAAGFSSPQAVVKGWINSEGHRANMLNSKYNEIGVGYFYMEDDVGEVNYRTYWGQLFGTGEIEAANPASAVTQSTSVPSTSSAPSASSPSPSVASGAQDETLIALQYGASNPDVLKAIGCNPEALWQHYLKFGKNEGRTLDCFDEVSYLASYDDLLNAFGSDTRAAVYHYVHSGFAEGRAKSQFQAEQYLASHRDLVNAFGYNPEAAGQHFIQWGYAEGRSRDTFDEGRYLASNRDLIVAFDYDLEAATQHYIHYGMSEGRSLDSFDPAAYLNHHGDLQAAFDNDLAAATRHFIEYGASEGRVW